ncbi:MAG: hypothetical protein OHK0048_18490 [Rhodoferax sp.]
MFNEELMSSNEELQSSNEELQSVNEELNTVNAEYQEKIEILNRLNADLDNLAQAVATSAVFVDEELNLTRFSPDAKQIFRLRESDLGRPLGDLMHNLLYPELINDIARALREDRRIEKEVQSTNGAHYFVRMLPYRMSSNDKLGTVVSFLDISVLGDGSRLQPIIDALPVQIAVLNNAGVITRVNAAWRIFAAENGDPELKHSATGTPYLDACQAIHSMDDTSAQNAQRGLRDVLEGRHTSFSMEYLCHWPHRQCVFLMHAARLSGEPSLVVSHMDISRRRSSGPTPS